MERENPSLRTPYRGRTRVMNVAHRGARAFAPENTLEAFRKAIDIGCDMVELDVHRTRDGELVVHHDDHLLRCTDARTRWPGRASYFISDFSWAELQSLDAGSWFAQELGRRSEDRQEFLRSLTSDEIDQYVGDASWKAYGSGEVRIPSLQQVLDELRPSGKFVNIELKTIPRMYPGLAESALALVQRLGDEDRVIFSSFDHVQLVQIRAMSSRVATAVLTCDRLAAPGRYLELIDADAYNPGCYGDYDSLGFGSVSGTLDARGIEDARSSDRGVNVWTCNDRSQMVRLIEAGVTGIISDYPNRVQAVLNGSQ